MGQRLIVEGDNDIRVIAQFWLLCNLRTVKGYTNLSSDLPLKGMVIEQTDLPKIGLWVMPDNRLSGYLEHFYESLIKAEDDLKPAVANAIQSLYDQNITRFSAVRKQKAFVHTWLAWQETPGASMGLTMKGKSDLFDFRQSNAQAFLSWSKQVFQFTEEE